MKMLFLLLLPASLLAGEPESYHALITSKRTYMDNVRTTRNEYWFTTDKVYSTNGRIATIERHDLGVVYTVVLRDSTYYVDSIRTARPAETAPGPIDFRYIGQDYVPVYDWTLRTRSERDSANRKVDHLSAVGEDDYARTELECWFRLCDDRLMAALFNKMAINTLAGSPSREPLATRLASLSDKIPFRIVETLNNPIAPLMINEIDIRLIERATPPDSIFELPKQAKKGH